MSTFEIELAAAAEDHEAAKAQLARDHASVLKFGTEAAMTDYRKSEKVEAAARERLQALRAAPADAAAKKAADEAAAAAKLATDIATWEDVLTDPVINASVMQRKATSTPEAWQAYLDGKPALAAIFARHEEDEQADREAKAAAALREEQTASWVARLADTATNRMVARVYASSTSREWQSYLAERPGLSEAIGVRIAARKAENAKRRSAAAAKVAPISNPDPFFRAGRDTPEEAKRKAEAASHNAAVASARLVGASYRQRGGWF